MLLRRGALRGRALHVSRLLPMDTPAPCSGSGSSQPADWTAVPQTPARPLCVHEVLVCSLQRAS